MYARRSLRWSVIARFSWKPLLVFTAYGIVVTAVAAWLRSRGVDVGLAPGPISTIGVAVAFYVGFKNNQAYDRFWEARKIWGGIVNVSRSWGNGVLTFVSAKHAGGEPEAGFIASDEVEAVRRRMIYRHLAWINALRFQLRRKSPWGFEPKGAARRFMQETELGAMRKELTPLLPESELGVVCERVNSATQILRLQGEDLRRAADVDGTIDEFRLISLNDMITECYTLQGKCERIKNTPLPRQYAFFSAVFTRIFIALLPLAIYGGFAAAGQNVWLSVPLFVVIAWVFETMEQVGDSSEDPFENYANDVPMSALCRTIEIDLRQMLSEKETPPGLKPVDDILM